MEDSPGITLKNLCCTCLSTDRKLFQLCRINDGVNNLYSLLSHDSEAYREGFYKEATSLFVCWECEAVMRRLVKFRKQACVAQKQLTFIEEGRNDVKPVKACLSRLLYTQKLTYDLEIVSESEESDNFIDCGPVAVSIKSENEDGDDIPLSELHSAHMSDNDDNCQLENDINNGKETKSKLKLKNRNKVKVKTKKVKSYSGRHKDYFVSSQMTEKEVIENRDARKVVDDFVNATFKCESCVEVFRSQTGLTKHNNAFHVEKDNHTQCTICKSYVPPDMLPDHKSSHSTRLDCLLCERQEQDLKRMWRHLKEAHDVRKVRRKKGEKKTEKPKSESKQRRGAVTTDLPTPYGYPCPECNKYFPNKNQRWKHVQRQHREGFKCATCGKRFAFKNNLSRHQLVHVGGARSQCATCHKLVRVDLLRVHARTHARRERGQCVECGKTFASRASYEHHLKYTQAHAGIDILKYKCDVCDKGYRSRGELRDHVNYQHIGQTQHKCPVCGKALATRRCITRHVRRAHQGVKEGPRDKICQQCGKAFRDKKGLREHEFTHTGERPLSCEVCGCTFRQTASLYTHRKRVHHIHAPRKTVTVVPPENVTVGTVGSADTNKSSN